MAGHGTINASEPIVYIDHSDVRGGSLEELKAGVRLLVDFIDAREPQLISYGFYVDEAASKMTVVAVHPDSASLELHMEIGSAEFRRLAHMLTLTSIECYRPAERKGARATAGEGGHTGRRRDRGFHRTIRRVHSPRTREHLSDRATPSKPILLNRAEYGVINGRFCLARPPRSHSPATATSTQTKNSRTWCGALVSLRPG